MTKKFDIWFFFWHYFNWKEGREESNNKKKKSLHTFKKCLHSVFSKGVYKRVKFIAARAFNLSFSNDAFVDKCDIIKHDAYWIPSKCDLFINFFFFWITVENKIISFIRAWNITLYKKKKSEVQLGSVHENYGRT